MRVSPYPCGTESLLPLGIEIRLARVKGIGIDILLARANPFGIEILLAGADRCCCFIDSSRLSLAGTFGECIDHLQDHSPILGMELLDAFELPQQAQMLRGCVELAC